MSPDLPRSSGPPLLQTLLSNVVHDLNNLLGPLLLYGELLQGTLSDAGQHKKITAIIGRTHLIRDVLDSLRLLYKEERWEGCATAFHLARHISVLAQPTLSKHRQEALFCVETGLPALTEREYAGRLSILWSIIQESVAAPSGAAFLAVWLNDGGESRVRLYVLPTVAEAGALAGPGPHILPGTAISELLDRLAGSARSIPLGDQAG